MPSVLFHVNDAAGAKHQAAVRNIANLLREMPELEVELVVQGEAITMAKEKESSVRSELASLQQQGLKIAVCHNTMVAKGVQPEQLIANVVIVPSAVGELVRRQGEGAAYVKP